MNLDTKIKTTSFGKASKELILNETELVFNSIRVNLDKVTDIKYGVEPIQFDMFYIGRRFVIDIKSNDVLIKIRLESYLGFSKAYFTNLFNQIVEQALSRVTNRIIEDTINEILEGGEVKIGNCVISKAGVSLKDFLIEWTDLSYQKNYDRLTINCYSNPKTWTNLYYLQNFNTDILLAVFEWVYKNNGLEEILKIPATNCE